jgi:hypothetical protein
MAHVKWTPRKIPLLESQRKLGVPKSSCSVRKTLEWRSCFGKLHPQADRITTQERLGRRAIYDALNTGGLAKRRIDSFAQSVVAKARAGDPNALSEAATCFLASTGTGDRQKVFDAITDEYHNARLNSKPEHLLENIQHVRDTASNA